MGQPPPQPLLEPQPPLRRRARWRNQGAAAQPLKVQETPAALLQQRLQQGSKGTPVPAAAPQLPAQLTGRGGVVVGKLQQHFGHQLPPDLLKSFLLGFQQLLPLQGGQVNQQQLEVQPQLQRQQLGVFPQLLLLAKKTLQVAPLAPQVVAQGGSFVPEAGQGGVLRSLGIRHQQLLLRHFQAAAKAAPQQLQRVAFQPQLQPAFPPQQPLTGP